MQSTGLFGHDRLLASLWHRAPGSLHLPNVLDLWSLAVTGGFPAVSLCRALTHLDFSGNTCITDFRPLAACTALVTLSARDNISLVDLGSIVESCLSLTALDLELCFGVFDLRPLATCSSLSCLISDGCERLQDVAPLASCTSLTYLSLRGCSGIKRCHVLAECRKLAILTLDGTSITDVNALAVCTALTWDSSSSAFVAP